MMVGFMKSDFFPGLRRGHVPRQRKGLTRHGETEKNNKCCVYTSVIMPLQGLSAGTYPTWAVSLVFCMYHG